MDAIFDQLRLLATKDGENSRLEVLRGLETLQMELQSPKENHIKFRVQDMTRFTCTRIAIDLGIIELLTKMNRPLSIITISEQTGAAKDLLRRILRHLASVKVIDETARDEFAANATTRDYAEPIWKAAIRSVFDARMLQALPDFLAETSYQNPTSLSSPAQKVLGITDTFFAHVTKEPKEAERMTKIQSITVQPSNSWLDGFPMVKELENTKLDHSRVLFVDLGGGMFNGQQCQGLKSRYPDLKGKVVLQDLQETLDRLKPMQGIVFMAHNFFEPQVIIGARFYYLREVLHDWSEDKCVEILKYLASALGNDSQILIDEMVLPDVGCSWHGTGADVAIMSIGGAERTIHEWEQLVHKAGLSISRVYSYNERSYRSVLVVQ